MKCKHDWVRSGYGNDLICTKCGYAASQATCTMPSSQATCTMPSAETMAMSNARQEVKITIYDGSKTDIASVYKDDLERQLSKAFNVNIFAGGRR